MVLGPAKETLVLASAAQYSVAVACASAERCVALLLHALTYLRRAPTVGEALMGQICRPPPRSLCRLSTCSQPKSTPTE